MELFLLVLIWSSSEFTYKEGGNGGDFAICPDKGISLTETECLDTGKK